MAKAKVKTLPDLPSKLLRLAIKDLIAVEKSKGYVIDMGTWHEPDVDYDFYTGKERSVCGVCFAGAVMAKSLKTAKDDFAEPADFKEERKLLFLDQARSGSVLDEYGDGYLNNLISERAEQDANTQLAEAKKLLKGIPAMQEYLDDFSISDLTYTICSQLESKIADCRVNIIAYERSPAKFKKGILKLAANLEKIRF